MRETHACQGGPVAPEVQKVVKYISPIFLTQCMEYIATKETNPVFDRVIVITDEQDCDRKQKPSQARKLGRFNHLVNVAPHKNGIAYNNGWQQIDGWSEHVIDYIRESELLETDSQ